MVPLHLCLLILNPFPQPDPLAWNNLKVVGTAPSPRTGHTFVPFGKFFVLFGGLDDELKGGKIAPNNQVYSLRYMNSTTYEWRPVKCEGAPPLPRTNHAACAISNDEMMVFGGYYSTNQRFNDTYILKVTVGKDWEWFQPPNQKVMTEPHNTESKIGAPEPRANHTLTYHEEIGKAFVFGGHGGIGYSRVTFNDLYSYDVRTHEWTKLEPLGEGPDPRGGHSACLLPNNQLLFYGGWSNHSQFSDMWIYDIKLNKWIDAEISHDVPRWNFSYAMTKAIPSWKMFVFGGSVGTFVEGHARNLGKFSDDLHFYDVNSKKWTNVPLADGNRPKARESATMFYSEHDSKLIVFGGWNNDWLGDIHYIPIGMITGPPYAIFSIKPKLGPYTGNTRVTISGTGFTSNQNFTVRFNYGKYNLDVEGTYVTETELTCKTPDFSSVGPKEVDVTLQATGGDFTITSTKFEFFLNTKADKTIAYGPGLLVENPIGDKTTFYIQARNEKGENRMSGSDEFVVDIKRIGEENEVRAPPVQEKPKDGKREKKEEGEDGAQDGADDEEQKEEAEPEVVVVPQATATVEDLGDGSYKVSLTSMEEGEADSTLR